ncbi:SUN domain-containing protein 2-like isoform X2 [Leptopilina boulardi]|nr:SUN domain-containing protein 2-like isoform X2 [Leptopilina boulardi]
MCNMDTRLLSPSNNLDESDEDSSTEPPNFEINAEDFGSQQNLKKGSPTKPDNGPDSNAPSGSHFNDSFASQQDDEEVTIENIRFLEGILRWSKDTFKEQTGQDYDSITGQPSSSQVPVMEENPRNKVLGTYRIKGLGKVEIAPDTNIWMDKVELEFIKTEFRKNPKEMARKLMKNLLGENNLINMSPTGRGDHTAIPKQVLDNVESFVKENVKKGFKIKHQEYIRTLTLMCNTLRNQLKAKNKTGNDSNKGKQTKKKRGAKNNEKVDKEKQKNGKRKKASNEKDENSSATKDENQEEIENTRKKRKQDLTVIDENRNEEIKKKKKKKKKHEHEQEKGDENLKLSEETRNENDNVNFSKDSDEILKLKEGINKDQSKEGKKKRKKKRKQGNEEKEDEDSAKWTEESISGNEKENLNPSEETDEILEVKDGMGEDRDEESKKTNKKKKKQVNEEEE